MHRKGVYNKTKESKMKKNFVLSQALCQQLNISNLSQCLDVLISQSCPITHIYEYSSKVGHTPSNSQGAVFL